MEKKFTKGKPAKASQINEIVHSLERANNMTAEQPIEIIRSQTGVVFRLNRSDTMFAKITSGANPYAWTEMLPGTGGTWTVRPGGLSGTTTDQPAYEVNQKSTAVNKIVKMYRGVFGEWLFEKKGHGSSCANATINVSSACGSGGSAIAGVTFELRDAADTTTLQTQTGASASFSVAGGASYKVRVSKTGYWTKTSGTIATTCGGTSTVTVVTWVVNYSFKTTALLNGCPISGATVSYTGDDSQIGVTDPSGEITFIFNSTSTNVVQSLSYTITPPTGHGAAVISGSLTQNACAPTDRTFSFLPDSTHVFVVCNARFLPEDFAWSDDYGTCTISYVGGSLWVGTYTYASTHCATVRIDCSVGFPGLWADGSDNVTVTCSMLATGTWSWCTTGPDIEISRSFWGGEAPPCSFPPNKCQPYGDSTSHNPLGQTQSTALGTLSLSCPTTSISITDVLPPASMAKSGGGTCNLEESSVTFTITGTI